MTKIIPEERAKQGRWGGKVLLVLVCALLLAAAAWFAVEMYGKAIDPEPTAPVTSTEG